MHPGGQGIASYESNLGRKERSQRGQSQKKTKERKRRICKIKFTKRVVLVQGVRNLRKKEGGGGQKKEKREPE